MNHSTSSFLDQVFSSVGSEQLVQRASVCSHQAMTLTKSFCFSFVEEIKIIHEVLFYWTVGSFSSPVGTDFLARACCWRIEHWLKVNISYQGGILIHLMFREPWHPLLGGCQTNYIRWMLSLSMGLTSGTGPPCVFIHLDQAQADVCHLCPQSMGWCAPSTGSLMVPPPVTQVWQNRSLVQACANKLGAWMLGGLFS